MLLSRVAENVFWAARYLERVETSARIVATHTELYLDLPRAAGLTWAPLLAITGSAEAFQQRYGDATEDNVVAFLQADPDNPGSLVASLAQARENLRTTRSVFPREAWEILNALHQRVEAECRDEVGRGRRLPWLAGVEGECQRLTGLMAGAMTQDEAYAFFRMGRHVERADMTTRVLDVQAGTLLGQTPGISPYADVLWMGVLKSVGGSHAFLRNGSARVRGSDVLRFLLKDPTFPRSVDHCLSVLERCVTALPGSAPVVLACLDARVLVEDARVRALAWDGLPEYVDELQVAIHDIHHALEGSYFRREPGALPAARAGLAAVARRPVRQTAAASA